MEPYICKQLTDRKMWPALLHEIPDKSKPKTLYVKGNLPPQDAMIVAVVGARNATSYGKDAAYEITRVLAHNGIVVASGMAMGIDSVAHKTAISEGAPTLAVLGSGLEESVMYPQENVALSRKITESCGALISEYEPGQKPELWTFPQRNRIIAGIARAVIVVEAGEKSGALITARFAAEFGRDVLAVPGSIFSAKSAGTNNLINQGATPITNPDDLPEILGIETKYQDKKETATTDDEKKILAALDSEELSIDEIIKNTQLSATKVLSTASSLELRGMIKGLGGGIYRKT